LATEPWIVAALEIAPPNERLRYGDQFHARRVAIIKQACEQHAAALAQERDTLRVELKRYKAHPVEADPREVVEALKMIEWNRELRATVATLNEQLFLAGNDRKDAEATVARLTAERDDWKHRYETRCRNANNDEAEAIAEDTAQLREQVARLTTERDSKEADCLALTNYLVKATAERDRLAVALRVARTFVERDPLGLPLKALAQIDAALSAQPDAPAAPSGAPRSDPPAP